MPKVYNHGYLEPSVYGNVMGLLRQHAGERGVHLDLGCGYGAIAERVRDDLGLAYVGFDISDDGLAALRERGFETHALDLSDVEAAIGTIRAAIGARALASMTIIDTLEHVANPREILAMLRQLSGDSRAPVVVSVPNVTHKDIAIKALIGRWDWTEAGLLDHTHVGFFNERHLTQMAAEHGWRQVAARDWLLEKSDQSFPPDLTPLEVATPLGGILRDVIERANPNCLVNQFVRAYLPDDEAATAPFPSRELSPGPFLTVVIRTQGRRTFQLRETLLSLGGQSDDDFDVLIVVHKADEAQEAAVRELVASFPESLSGKTHIVLCAAEGRAAPLNAALGQALGSYVAFLDDDDFVFGHWVETFHESTKENPGKIVRAACVRQHVSWRPDSPLGAHPSPSTWFEIPYPSRYDLLEHLYDNRTPFMSLAFPRSVFRDLGLRFDQSLSTAEDWDFTCRAAQLCGIASTPTITAVYRWWDNSATSMTTIAQEEWKDNRLKVINKLNAAPVLLPQGGTQAIVSMIERDIAVSERLNLVNQRELQLYNRNIELDQREMELHSRAVQVEQRAAQVEQRAAQVEQRNAQVDKRETELRVRANQVDRHEVELHSRAGQVNRHELELRRRAKYWIFPRINFKSVRRRIQKMYSPESSD